MNRAANQGELFAYMQPDGSPALHPPLCACGACLCPVERFETPAPVYTTTIGVDRWGTRRHVLVDEFGMPTVWQDAVDSSLEFAEGRP